MPPRQRDRRRQPRTLRAHRLFRDLHDYFLPTTQLLLDRQIAALRLLPTPSAATPPRRLLSRRLRALAALIYVLAVWRGGFVERNFAVAVFADRFGLDVFLDNFRDVAQRRDAVLEIRDV